MVLRWWAVIIRMTAVLAHLQRGRKRAESSTLYVLRPSIAKRGADNVFCVASGYTMVKVTAHNFDVRPLPAIAQAHAFHDFHPTIDNGGHTAKGLQHVGSALAGARSPAQPQIGAHENLGFLCHTLYVARPCTTVKV